MSGVWRLLPCLGLRYVVWRHGGGAERLWSEKRSVLRCPTQRTALPLAARCNYGCSALHLKSSCSADSWGMGPASFSQRFPLLLPFFSTSPLFFLRIFFSALSASPLIPFLFFFPLLSACLCPALPPSSYCMAKPCRPWCHAGLCCLARPRQRTCACGTA